MMLLYIPNGGDKACSESVIRKPQQQATLPYSCRLEEGHHIRMNTVFYLRGCCHNTLTSRSERNDRTSNEKSENLSGVQLTAIKKYTGFGALDQGFDD